MNAASTTRLALRTLRRAMLRSALSCLGVVIGVASLVALVSTFEGGIAKYSRFSDSQLRHLAVAANTLRKTRLLDSENQLAPIGERLTVADYMAVASALENRAITGVKLAHNGTIRAYGRQARATCWGVDTSGLVVNATGEREVLEGSMFGPSDAAAAALVCVITKSLSDHFFPEGQSLGRSLFIGPVPFRITGVVADRQSPGAGVVTTESAVWLPYTSILRRVNPSASITLEILVDRPEELPGIRDEVLELLSSRKGLRRVEFAAINIAETMKQMRAQTAVVAQILGSIAGISLIVGGIGIMNIMYANVSERTREIGIRSSFGTRPSDLLRQFLLEALILTVSGGVLGTALGLGVTALLARIFEWPIVLSYNALLGGLGSSTLVGLFFGYYPAKRAAMLDPIVALRHE